MEIAGPSGSQGDEERVKVVSVSCGSSHSIALLSKSNFILVVCRRLIFRMHRTQACTFSGCDIVMAWGRGEDGQLGHGDADDRNGPEAIHTLIRKGVTGVHCGAEYTVAVCREQQEVYSWGW